MVDQIEVFGKYMVGHEIPLGHSVIFQYEGCWNQRMVLYDVCKTDKMMGSAWLVEFASNLGPMGVRNPNLFDMRYAHDVLSGLGGFSTACEFLSVSVVSPVDSNHLANRAFALNHTAPVIAADIGLASTVHHMLREFNRCCWQASHVNHFHPKVSSCGTWMLEARPFQLCFELLFGLGPWVLPILQPAPCLGDLFPYEPWPVWNLDDGETLCWTPMELEVYHNPTYGPTDRRLNLNEACPLPFTLVVQLCLPARADAETKGSCQSA